MTHRCIAAGGIIDGAVLVGTEKFHPPVRTVRESFQCLSVVGQEVYLLPACFETAGHVKPLVSEEHAVDPVKPSLVFLMVDMLLGTVRSRNAVKVQGILDSRLTGNEELFAVSAPERSSEILVLLRIEIRPHDLRRGIGSLAVKVNDTDSHLRVALSGLRITCLVKGSVLSKRRIDREHRNGRIVETVESDLAGIR